MKKVLIILSAAALLAAGVTAIVKRRGQTT